MLVGYDHFPPKPVVGYAYVFSLHLENARASPDFISIHIIDICVGPAFCLYVGVSETGFDETW